MLPGRDGFSICDEVRKVDRDQPIIMLTAKTSDEDIVNGLTLGADDYVAKPFAIAQLVLRVKAVLRRSRVGVESAAKIALDGDVEIDTRNLSGRRGAETLAFTRREIEILQYLHRTPSARCRARSCSRASGATTARPRSRRARSTSTSRSCGARSSPTRRSRAICVTVRGAGYRLVSSALTCAREIFGKLDERRIRWLLAAFFLALAVPAGVLIGQAYDQLKWEAFRSTQLLAEDFAARVDTDLRAAVAAEEARSFGDYSFLVVEGDAAANFVQRSPLSAFPVASAVPGALGYFQVDAAGALTTPLLPRRGVDAAGYGIGPTSSPRARRCRAISEVLAQNRLVPRSARRSAGARCRADARERGAAACRGASSATRPSARERAPRRRSRAGGVRPARGREAPPRRGAAAARRRGRAAQRARRADRRDASAPRRAGGAGARRRELDARRSASESPTRPRRRKTPAEALGAEPRARAASPARGVAEAARRRRAQAELRVRTFESELDPFEVGVLDTGHLVMFRNVWRGGQRYIQGVLDRARAFVAARDRAPFRASSLAGDQRHRRHVSGARSSVARAAAVGRSIGVRGARGLAAVPRAAVAAVRRSRARVPRDAAAARAGRLAARGCR